MRSLATEPCDRPGRPSRWPRPRSPSRSRPGARRSAG